MYQGTIQKATSNAICFLDLDEMSRSHNEVKYHRRECFFASKYFLSMNLFNCQLGRHSITEKLRLFYLFTGKNVIPIKCFFHRFDIVFKENQETVSISVFYLKSMNFSKIIFCYLSIRKSQNCLSSHNFEFSLV